MKSAFDPQIGAWQIAWPGRLSRYDLVYQSPPAEPMQGIPLGNGDVGALCWCEGSRLIFAVNKCDLWDDAGYGQFSNWRAEEEETGTTLRHACRLILDFQRPIFDIFYLRDFQARLSLADASLHLSVTGPFGQVDLLAYIDHDSGLLYGNLKYDLAEGVVPVLLLERYGSRTFAHWYAQVSRDASVGLAGAGARIDTRGMALSQRLRTGAFAVACEVCAKGGSVRYSRLHSHSVSAAPDRKTRALVWKLVVASPRAAGIYDLAWKKLARAAATDGEAIWQSHSKAWQEFWLRSLMESGNPYLDNLWNLTCYYAAASQRGPYPGRFIGGLWGFARDAQPWNHYFHWNQQEIYWPLNAAGHHDLLTGYLEFRFRGLPHAREDARELYGVDGAAVTDVCDRRGYNSRAERDNHTPVAQIALDFWDQYLFTGDRRFLLERALPYLCSACGFFASLFVKEADGLYHARQGTAYEGWILLKDSITELAMAESLFRATLQALSDADAKDERAELWRDMLAHLAPLPLMTAPADWIAAGESGPVYQLGPFRGQPAVSSETLAAGFGLTEQHTLFSRVVAQKTPPPDLDGQAALRHMLTEHRHLFGEAVDTDCYAGIFPVAEMAAVFPHGPVGLAEQGSARFQAADNMAHLYAPDCMGWDPLPIVMARLGLGEPLSGLLTAFAERWQFYCNGFGHYGPLECMYADANLPGRTTVVINAATAGQPDEEHFTFPAYPFRHMGMESMSVLSAALNEALLQSHESVLRIFPALAPGQNARFTLHARGGFIVSAAAADGRALWAHIRSLRGFPCVLINPWPKAYVFRTDGSLLLESTDEKLEITITADTAVLIGPSADLVHDWEVETESPQPNDKPRRLGETQLGLGRLY